MPWEGLLIDGEPRKWDDLKNCGIKPEKIRSFCKPRNIEDGVYHVTESNNPPYIINFERTMPYYKTFDSVVLMGIGTAVHEMLECYTWEEEGANTEVKTTFPIDDFTIVGSMDRLQLDPPLITDYKVLGAWMANQVLTEQKQDYFRQLNLYRYGIKYQHDIIADMELDIFIRDYGTASRRYGLDRANYIKKVPYIEDEQILDIARKNIVESLHEPRLCTKDEQWGGRRCAAFCDAYTCPNYKGIKYELG